MSQSQNQPKQPNSRECIPLEIVDMILGYHAKANDGNTLLYPCSLVSSSWSAICSCYLSKGAKVRLVSCQLRHPDPFYTNLALYPLHSIRNITIFIQPAGGEDDNDISALSHHLQSTHNIISQFMGRINVNTLALVMDFASPLLNHRDYHDLLVTCFPQSHITRLDLDFRMETFNSLFAFISSFTRLEFLGISCEVLLDSDDLHNEMDQITLPPLLHTLHLNISIFHGFAWDTICDWLRSQIPLGNLRYLSILNCDCATGPGERVPTYLQLSSNLTSLYISFPSDDVDPLSYLGDDEYEYVYDLSHLTHLDTLGVHIPDSKVSPAPLPKLEVILSRLKHTLKSLPFPNRLRKLNLVIGRHNLVSSTLEWHAFDELLFSEQFSCVQKEIYVPVHGCDVQERLEYVQRVLHLFYRCNEQGRLSVSLINRYQRSGVNLLMMDPL